MVILLMSMPVGLARSKYAGVLKLTCLNKDSLVLDDLNFIRKLISFLVVSIVVSLLSFRCVMMCKQILMQKDSSSLVKWPYVVERVEKNYPKNPA